MPSLYPQSKTTIFFCLFFHYLVIEGKINKILTLLPPFCQTEKECLGIYKCFTLYFYFFKSNWENILAKNKHIETQMYTYTYIYVIIYFNTSVLIFSSLSISKAGYYCIEKIILQIFLWIVEKFLIQPFHTVLYDSRSSYLWKKRDCLHQNQSSFESEVMFYPG